MTRHSQLMVLIESGSHIKPVVGEQPDAGSMIPYLAGELTRREWGLEAYARADHGRTHG